MNVPLVSLIVPCFNAESMIDPFFDHLKTFNYPKLEVVIGDDGSSDNTYQKILNHSQNKDVVIFKSDENIGAGAMRNKLISIASGDLIAIHDVDDFSTEDRIQKQVEMLQSNPSIDIVGSSCKLTFNGEAWGEISPPQNPHLMDWLLQRSMVHATIMFRKEIKDQAHYNQKLSVAEDYYFLSMLYNKGFKFFNLDAVTYYYNIDPKDLRTRSLKNFRSVIKSIFIISSTFPVILRIPFIILSFTKLTISSFRGLFF